jgi:1-aminocyclopropane-1-carboxylate deaminase/D-cysteine desulfhydrase-like pyridoxal-dependent ACC family enzyme
MSRERVARRMDHKRLFDLRTKLDNLPRFRVARLPTPLDEVPRFAAALGKVRIFVKREDLTGLAFGGNKTRELDFFIGDALRVEADVFIAGGGVAQSNHAVQCAAAARQAGMVPVMVLHRFRAEEPQGNLLLLRLMDVDVRFADTEGVDSAINQRTVLQDMMQKVAEEYRARGHRPYVLPSSFHPLGAIGYVDCALELAAQLEQRDIRVDRVYLASAGATQVGLVLGAKHLRCSFRVTGISYTTSTERLKERMVALGAEAAARLGIDTHVEASDLLNESFAGPGYGIPTPDGIEAIHLLAKTEGMFLDPVYTAKGMAGLIAHIRSKRIQDGETVVFVHTGGLPALFAYNREVL